MSAGPNPLSCVDDGASDRVVQLASERLRNNFPDLIAAASAEELTQAAVNALERARGHGFNRRRQMYFMVHLSTALGSGFDSDPQYRWLHPLLDNRLGLAATQRSQVMCWHVDAFRVRAYGGELATARQRWRVCWPLIKPSLVWSAGTCPTKAQGYWQLCFQEGLISWTGRPCFRC